MIVAETSANVDAVARHYDELDAFYREIWGEHVHHGLWLTGRETSDRAVVQLVERVAERARTRPGSTVCDAGCGYGATARLLARRWGAQVTALTITPRQYHLARNAEPPSPNPVYLLRDWLRNDLPAAHFDSVIAIESIEHMPDKPRALSEAARVLKDGGRLVVCAWLAGDHPRRWQETHLLQRICAEGRLPEMHTAAEFQSLMEENGFALERFEDVSHQVRRTWRICLGRTAREICRQPEWRRFLFRGDSDNRVFGFTMIRIWLAYQTGAMRYGIFTARRD